MADKNMRPKLRARAKYFYVAMQRESGLRPKPQARGGQAPAALYASGHYIWGPRRRKGKGGGFGRRPQGDASVDQKFFVIRTPMRRGSVTKTLVVRAVSSEFRKAPVMAVLLNTFFT